MYVFAPMSAAVLEQVFVPAGSGSGRRRGGARCMAQQARVLPQAVAGVVAAASYGAGAIVAKIPAQNRLDHYDSFFIGATN